MRHCTKYRDMASIGNNIMRRIQIRKLIMCFLKASGLFTCHSLVIRKETITYNEKYTLPKSLD